MITIAVCTHNEWMVFEIQVLFLHLLQLSEMSLYISMEVIGRLSGETSWKPFVANRWFHHHLGSRELAV